MDRTESQVAGSNTDTAERALAAFALDDAFTVEAGRAMVQRDGSSVIAALAAYQASLAPMKGLDSEAQKIAAASLEDALRPIGAKMAPHLSGEQCKTWRVAMVAALSDLAPRTAVRAAREALHVPMQFMSEVDGVIRAKALEIEARHRRAIMRLQKLQDEIASASIPKLSDHSDRSLTADELRRLPAAALRMGVAAGHITADELQAAGIDIEERAA